MDVSTSVGIDRRQVAGGEGLRSSLGQGLCWLDLEGDGDPDLFAPSGARVSRSRYQPSDPDLSPWALYENRSGRFTEVAAARGIRGGDWALGCAVGDVNADGLDDLLVTTATGPNRLFVNLGGRFDERGVQAGIGDTAMSTGAAFGDLDGDGDLDLVVATYADEKHPPPGPCRWKGIEVMCGPRGYPQLEDKLYFNDGDGNFQASDALADEEGFGLGVLLLDADDDGRGDIYVANDSTPNRLFLNRGEGRFEEVGLQAGVALSRNGAAQAGMGVDAGDLDGDGADDIVVTNFSEDTHNFYRRVAPAQFVEWTNRSGLAAASFLKLGWAVLIEDLDMDGHSDLVLVNGHVYPQMEELGNYRQPIQILFNDGAGRLFAAPDRVGPIGQLEIPGRGAAVADIDGDGDPDIAVSRINAPPLLLRNDLPKSADILKVSLSGPAGNPRGIGAVVRHRLGDTTRRRTVRASRGYLSSSEPVVYFVRPAHDSGELDVLWPDGIRQQIRVYSEDREIRVQHPAARRPSVTTD